MKDISLTYRDKFLRNQSSFNAKYKKLFDKVANDISLLVSDPNARFSKSFNFNPTIEKKITAITSQFQADNLKLTEQEIAASWKLSNEKNDEIVKDYIKNVTGLKTAEKAALFIPNTPALEAFIARDRGAGTLADAIWKVSTQMRGEMEIHLGMSLLNGDSAQVTSRRIRQYLNNPDALFRRVRDKNGKLVASKAMIENAPGQGHYNSAYKNAMRVARTETNQAYQAADNERWNNLDFVRGVLISISEQHKIFDICDECQGEYPKEFYWTGWHVMCLCHATPILMPQSDFERSLAGEDAKAEPITEMPENFNNYMKDNYDRYMGYKSQPYFMQDNTKIINGIMKGEKAVAPISVRSVKQFSLNETEIKLLKNTGFKEIDKLAYDKSMKGFDLVSFDKKVQSICDEAGIKINSRWLGNGGLSNDAILNYSGEYNGEIFKIKNIFSERNGIKSVYHDEFLIPKGLQNKGIGKQLMSELYGEYTKNGVKEITLHAGFEVGGYAWAKYGFKAYYNQISKLIDYAYEQTSKGVISFGEYNKFEAFIKTVKEGELVNMFEIANMPYGKKLLIGSDWNGVLDLTDTVSKTIFENYLKR